MKLPPPEFDHVVTRMMRVLCRAILVGALAIGAWTCAKKVVVVPIVVLPLTTWTIPLSLADDVNLCVATELAPFIDPADVRPLRCVSVGAVRAWIRGQRMANE